MSTPTSAEMLELADEIREPQYLSDYAARAAAAELAKHWESHLREGAAIEHLIETDLEGAISTLRQFGEKMRARVTGEQRGEGS